jgi:hypothetical protein
MRQQFLAGQGAFGPDEFYYFGFHLDFFNPV